MPSHDVDILDVNTFQKTGRIKNIHEAWRDGDWLGTFNLWVLREIEGIFYILYQKRTSKGLWAPGLLDVTAGGHYEVGETVHDGLREVSEEIGKDYIFEDLYYLGKKLYLRDYKDRKLRYVVDVFFMIDNSPLDSFKLDKIELEGLYECPISSLIQTHTVENYSFTASGIKIHEENDIQVSDSIVVRKKTFPVNWDNYHFKIALLADRFLKLERPIIY